MTMGERIQRARKALGWSQERLAENLSVTRQAVSKWELDESQPEVHNIRRLMVLFDVSADYLLGADTDGDMPGGSEAAMGEAARASRAKAERARAERSMVAYTWAAVACFAIGFVGLLVVQAMAMQRGGGLYETNAFIRDRGLVPLVWSFFAMGVPVAGLLMAAADAQRRRCERRGLGFSVRGARR